MRYYEAVAHEIYKIYKKDKVYFEEILIEMTHKLINKKDNGFVGKLITVETDIRKKYNKVNKKNNTNNIMKGCIGMIAIRFFPSLLEPELYDTVTFKALSSFKQLLDEGKKPSKITGNDVRSLEPSIGTGLVDNVTRGAKATAILINHK